MTSNLYFLVGRLLFDCSCFLEGEKGPMALLPTRGKGEQEASFSPREGEGAARVLSALAKAEQCLELSVLGHWLALCFSYLRRRPLPNRGRQKIDSRELLLQWERRCVWVYNEGTLQIIPW